MLHLQSMDISWGHVIVCTCSVLIMTCSQVHSSGMHDWMGTNYQNGLDYPGGCFKVNNLTPRMFVVFLFFLFCSFFLFFPMGSAGFFQMPFFLDLLVRSEGVL